MRILSLCFVLLLAAAATMSATPCLGVDNGGGTVNLPPGGCAYAAQGPLLMDNGFPPASSIVIPVAVLTVLPGGTEGAGGGLGGTQEDFPSLLEFQLTGTGGLAGYNRTITLPTMCEVHTGPRTAGTPVQSFDTDLLGCQGQIAGDPDFDLLRITAGTGFGLPSPGHTTLTQLGGTGNWNVDSFFDVSYKIDFVGRPGGAFSGMSGSSTHDPIFQLGDPVPEPGTMSLLLGGGLAFTLAARRKPKQYVNRGRDSGKGGV